MGLLDGLFGKAPKPPDPTQTANTQAQYNTQAGNQTLSNNAMDRNGPFGSSAFQRDPTTGLPTGINTSFSGGLQGGVNNITGGFGAQSGGLPSGIDFGNGVNTDQYVQQGMGAYDAANAGNLAQGQRRIDQEVANRGIPINDQIAKDLQGNFDQGNETSRASEFNRLLGMTPGMRAQDTSTAINQGMAPGQLTGQSLGLLQGANGLLPQAQQPQANYGAPDYSGLVNTNYAQQMAGYNANQAGLGNLLKTGASLLAAPMTGGTSLFGMGVDKVGDMWNSSSLNPAKNFSP